MSKENVEVVRRIVDAHQRGDFASVFAAYDPAIEWHTGSVGAQWSGDSRAAQWSEFELLIRSQLRWSALPAHKASLRRPAMLLAATSMPPTSLRRYRRPYERAA